MLDREGIRLALWMHERYYCTVYHAIKAMLPAGLYFSLKGRVLYCAGGGSGASVNSADTPAMQKVLDLVYAGSRTGWKRELCWRHLVPPIRALRCTG